MIVQRAQLRFLRARPWQTVASIVGIGLGVAVVVAIDMVNTSAERGFEIANDVVGGGATHRILGGPGGIDEALYRRLRVEEGIAQAAPVVEGWVQLAGAERRWMRLLGIDPFAGAGFGQRLAEFDVDAVALLRTTGGVLLSDASASALGLAAGAATDVIAGGQRHGLSVLDVLAVGDSPAGGGLTATFVADIATAQIVLGMGGRLSHIDLVVADVEQVQRLERLLPAPVRMVTAGSRGNAQRQMTRAFQINLTALSLLALLVGMFLIYNTMTFSVVQRRAQLGIFRALGVTRAEVFAAILLEALLIGVVASALGVALGAVLAQGLLRFVARTINDLYFQLEVTRATLQTLTLAKALAVGILASAAAACLPAFEATRAPPRQALSRSALEQAARGGSRAAAIAGVSMAAGGIALLAMPGAGLLLGFLCLFLLILGYALLVPLCTVAFVRAATRLTGAVLGLVGRMAARGVAAALSRTGVAVAALTVAVAATVGIGVMIGSFRVSVQQWLAAYLRADVYLSLPATAAGAGLEARFLEELRALPGVADVALGRWAELEGENERLQLFALDVRRRGFEGFQLKQGSVDAVWEAFQGGEAVIVSEPFAHHHRLRVGDTLPLPTVHGRRSFPVAGVYVDYGSDRGVVTMSRSTYLANWRDPVITAASLYLEDDARADAVIEQILSMGHLPEGLRLRSVGALRAASLEVFDRTFTVTAVLRVVAVVVAAVGILAALMAIQLERAREAAVLRVVGLAPRELWRLILAETGLMGTAAGLLAAPLGVGMAYVLVAVINRRSFGWTMAFSVDISILLESLLLAIGAALLAGLYPAWRMTRAWPAAGLRAE